MHWLLAKKEPHATDVLFGAFGRVVQRVAGIAYVVEKGIAQGIRIGRWTIVRARDA